MNATTPPFVQIAQKRLPVRHVRVARQQDDDDTRICLAVGTCVADDVQDVCRYQCTDVGHCIDNALYEYGHLRHNHTVYSRLGLQLPAVHHNGYIVRY